MLLGVTKEKTDLTMRQPDINRVLKALDHLKAASLILNNIKWENTTGKEDGLLHEARQAFRVAGDYLQDVINIQGEK